MTSPENPPPDVPPLIVLERDSAADAVPLAEARRLPRGARVAAIVAAAVAVAVLVGGGTLAVAAWNRAFGGQPAEAMPASVYAFAQLDLRPGFGQRVAADALVRRAGAAGTREDLLKQLRAPLAELLELRDTRLHTWFDGRAGVAQWSTGGRAVTLVAVASADDRRARAALSAVRDARAKGTGSAVGFVIADGYALIAVGGDPQAAAEAAAAEARTAPLADDAGYRAAAARLPGDRLAFAWADLDRLRTAPAAVRANLGEELTTDATAEKYLHGVVVAAVTAADGALEVRTRLTGSRLPRLGDIGARRWLDDTPGSPTYAFAGDLSGGLGLDSELLDGMAFGILGPPLDYTAAADPMAADGLYGLFGRHRRDVRAARVALYSGGVPEPSGDGSVEVRVTDAAAARRLGAAARAGDAGLTVKVTGDQVKIARGRAPATRLGDDPAYRRALAGAPASAVAATYLSARELTDLTDGEDPLRALTGVGAACWYDGADLVGSVRLLVG